MTGHAGASAQLSYAAGQATLSLCTQLLFLVMEGMGVGDLQMKEGKQPEFGCQLLGVLCSSDGKNEPERQLL